VATTSLETNLVNKVKSLITQKYGGRCIKIHPDIFGNKGEPDVIGCINGRFVGIECKADGERPRPLQMRKLELWREAGGIAFWVDSIEEAEERLKDEIET
jgi:hypothetical protein